jgi:hypothetical protein
MFSIRTDLQRPDNESPGWRDRAVSKHVCLFSGKIRFFDRASSDQGADDIGWQRDIGGTAIDDEIQRDSVPRETAGAMAWLLERGGVDGDCGRPSQCLANRQEFRE